MHQFYLVCFLTAYVVGEILGEFWPTSRAKQGYAVVSHVSESASDATKGGNPLKEALSKAKPTDGHPNQLMHELEDGTRVIFRKDFGDQAHPIGGPFQGKGNIDHYNIEIQRPNTRRPNKMNTIENLHVAPDGKVGVTAFDKNGRGR